MVVQTTSQPAIHKNKAVEEGQSFWQLGPDEWTITLFLVEYKNIKRGHKDKRRVKKGGKQ